jgi:hypothetical protein
MTSSDSFCNQALVNGGNKRKAEEEAKQDPPKHQKLEPVAMRAAAKKAMEGLALAADGDELFDKGDGPFEMKGRKGRPRQSKPKSPGTNKDVLFIIMGRQDSKGTICS